MRKILVVLVVAILLVAFFLPKILETPFGKPLFENALGEKFNATVSIGSLHLSWLGPQSLQQIHISNSEMEGSIDELNSNVPFWQLNQFGKAFSLQNGTFTLPAYGNLKVEQVEAKVVGQDVFATGQSTQGGSFSIKGKIYAKNDVDLIGNFHQMPPALFDSFLNTKGLLTALLGPSMDISSTLVYKQGEGLLNIDLAATFAKLSLHGQISKDFLLLKDSLAATLFWHPELSKITDGHVVNAKFPISLQIDPDKTAIPINPFSLNQLIIGHATLDLGRLVLQNVSPLVSFLSLLQRGSIGSSAIPIWFTPVAFSLYQGKAEIGRIDALIESAIHLCAWGKIDLPNQLNMILGIPADTLENALGIKGLPRNYVLQIPVRGTIQNPKYDSGAATAKITAWLATQQATKATGIFGQVFNRLIKPAQEDQDVPPPNRPFPWER